MDDPFLHAGRRHVDEIQRVNRNLIEQAFRMRCVSYLAHVKSQLLTKTIFGIDSSKKTLQHLTQQVEERNRELEAIRATLERRVAERTEALQRELEEKTALQQQLVVAQKMECVGRLAGGLAHDFNNLLSVVLGYSQLALTSVPPDSQLGQDLREIFEAGEKAVVLVRQLLAVSRRQHLELRTVCLNDVVANISRLLDRTLGDDVELVLRLDEPRCFVRADIGQLEQVLLNLAVNARDAMPRGGSLVIEASQVTFDEEAATSHQVAGPGCYAMLAITDTGTGIPADIIDTIFDPFFTTKAPGQGTGLGLSSVLGIVRQHHGTITVYSEVDNGTTFKLYLPLADGTEAATVEQPSRLMPRGTETVLVVDDEPCIRRLVTDTLQPLGYRVIEAASGEAALALTLDEAVDVLLADVIMPGMYGV